MADRDPDAPTPTGRIVSMDQYRGYTVAGMFVVNFLAGLHAVHPVFKHNHFYFSYADSIMPGFLFAAGFSYRLTMLRRLQQAGPGPAYRRAVTRGLALILVSLALFGLGGTFAKWDDMTAAGVREFVARLLKAHLWEVLAIIGAAQLVILPVVTARPAVRLVTGLILMAIHVALSHSFNYDFVYARPNWMDAWWGAAKCRAWDGGFFGLLMWAVPLLGGTLAFDLVGGPGPVRRLLGWGLGLMAVGYSLSCLATLHDPPSPPSPGADRHAASPVIPPWDRAAGRSLASLLAEPPCVAPPATRPLNYWMMDKRVVTVPFILFSTGWAFALYGLFVLACDRGGWQLALFRVLGQNPLAAYLLHHPIEKTVRAVVPQDAPLWWCLIGLAMFFTVTTAFVRFLDRHKLYLRL